MPSTRLRARWLWGLTICLSVTAFALYDVWGQTWTDYCGASKSARCNYPVAWLVIFTCTLSAGLLLRLVWKSHFSPWSYCYGISTGRALSAIGDKLGKVRSHRLERKVSRIDWFGDVRFSKSRSGLAFHALDERDAKRAVYWANEGRFRSDILEPAP